MYTEDVDGSSDLFIRYIEAKNKIKELKSEVEKLRTEIIVNFKESNISCNDYVKLETRTKRSVSNDLILEKFNLTDLEEFKVETTYEQLSIL